MRNHGIGNSKPVLGAVLDVFLRVGLDVSSRTSSYKHVLWGWEYDMA